MDVKKMTIKEIMRELITPDVKDDRAADLRKALRRKHIKAKQNFSAQDILDKVRFMKGEK